MRDISNKTNTLRIASARSILKVSNNLIDRIQNNAVPKGNPLELARYAAIQSAKNTSQIIPYCHQVPIDFVGVDFQLNADSIVITTTIKAIYKTGVEMEALTAASVAALTIYDMLKPFDETMTIENISLVGKFGGKSEYKFSDKIKISSAVIVLSDSIAKDEKQDESGQLIVRRLEEEGLHVVKYLVLPDEKDIIVSAIKDLCDNEKIRLIVTTGGTGPSERDNTSEAVMTLIEKEIPGIGETMRNYGQARNRFSMLSRSVAGLRNESLIVALPGSKGGVEDSLNAIFPAILHIFEVRNGHEHNHK